MILNQLEIDSIVCEPDSVIAYTNNIQAVKYIDRQSQHSQPQFTPKKEMRKSSDELHHLPKEPFYHKKR